MSNTRVLWPWKGHLWSMAELARAHGVKYGVVYGRLKTMTLEAALRDLKWDGTYPKKVDWQTCPNCKRIYRSGYALMRHREIMHKGIIV